MIVNLHVNERLQTMRDCREFLNNNKPHKRGWLQARKLTEPETNQELEEIGSRNMFPAEKRRFERRKTGYQ
jgi:hypothetical protein